LISTTDDPNRSPEARREPQDILQCTTKRDFAMTKMLHLMDRAALGLINVLVVIGLPLVAIGMLTNSF